MCGWSAGDKDSYMSEINPKGCSAGGTGGRDVAVADLEEGGWRHRRPRIAGVIGESQSLSAGRREG